MAASFTDRLTSALSGTLIGLYLVGSYALRDMQPGSDVDFVAVVAGDLDAKAVEQLRSLHDWMASTYPKRPFEGFYVDEKDFRNHPDPASKRGFQYLGGTLCENDEVRLVEWEMLRRCGKTVVGRPVSELDVFDASADLASFSHKNLEEYWVPWIGSAPRIMSGRPIGRMRNRMAWAAAWCVLGIPRLHIAIADGAIVSKTEAGLRARSRFDPKWQPLIDAALDHRRRCDRKSSRLLAGMRGDALEFSKHVLEVALALPC